MFRQSLLNSGLHYFINESPHSIWITIRKKFIVYPVVENIAQESSTDIVQCKAEGFNSDYRELDESHKQLIAALRNEFEIEISDHKETKDANVKLFEQITRKDKANYDLKQEIKIIATNLEVVESNSKKSNKIIKQKEKDLYDLKKEHSKEKEDLESIDKELKELKAKVIREEKEFKRKSKKQEKKDFLKNLKTENKLEEIECDKCDAKMSTIQHMKTHTRVHHMKESPTQTDDITLEDKSVQSEESVTNCDKTIQTCEVIISEQPQIIVSVKYPCYYCAINIESKEHLRDHKKRCHEKLVPFNLVKSVPPKFEFPQIGFPPVGFPPVGFPTINQTRLSTFYSPLG